MIVNPRHPDSEFVISNHLSGTWVHVSVEQWFTENKGRLSIRLRNCIASESDAKGLSIGDLIDMGDRELLRIPNFGKASLREFRTLTQPTPVGAGPQRDWLLVPRSPAALRSRR